MEQSNQSTAKDNHRDTSGPQRQELDWALDTVVNILVGSRIEPIRDSVGELDKKLSAVLANLERETRKSIGTLREDLDLKLTNGISLAKKESTEAIEAVETVLSTQVDEFLGKQAQAEQTQKKALADYMDEQIRTLRSNVETRLSAYEENARTELQGVVGQLTEVRTELQKHVEATSKLSSVLKSMATVFNAGGRPEEPARVAPREPVKQPGLQVTRQPVVPGTSTQSSSPARPKNEVPPTIRSEEVDNAFQKMFDQDEWGDSGSEFDR